VTQRFKIHFYVPGGYGNDNDDVMILNLSNPTEWEYLDPAPTYILDGYFVRDGEDLIIVNTYPGNMLRFDKNTLTFSVIEGSSLIYDDVGVTVLAVNDDVLYGCE